jgi:hypothetical protein
MLKTQTRTRGHAGRLLFSARLELHLPALLAPFGQQR